MFPLVEPKRTWGRKGTGLVTPGSAQKRRPRDRMAITVITASEEPELRVHPPRSVPAWPRLPGVLPTGCSEVHTSVCPASHGPTGQGTDLPRSGVSRAVGLPHSLVSVTVARCAGDLGQVTEKTPFTGITWRQTLHRSSGCWPTFTCSSSSPPGQAKAAQVPGEDGRPGAWDTRCPSHGFPATRLELRDCSGSMWVSVPHNKHPGSASTEKSCSLRLRSCLLSSGVLIGHLWPSWAWH